MSILNSLRSDYTAAVFGASGGLGAAFVRQLASDPRCKTIFAGARTQSAPMAKCVPFGFDLTDEPSIARAAETISRDGALDLVVVATGMLHTDTIKPEKGMRWLAPAALAQIHAVNAIGPALVAKHLLPLLPRDRKSVFAALSARVGSISDNQLGGWHGYRASKAALNQFIRTCAIELAVKNRHAVCVTLHPGTADTALSKPFQANMEAGKLSTPDKSVSSLLRVLDGLTPAQSGQFFAWDGSTIAY
jgi:NAD(P)-dependent dehydrogenase (short-subunit alcohol dehydrogenase family)